MANKPGKNVKKLTHKLEYVNKVAGDNFPSTRFVNVMVDEEMAAAANVLKRRKPMYITDFAKKLGKTYEEGYEMADRLCMRGITEWTWDDDGKEMINLPLLAPGSMELALMNNTPLTKEEQTVAAKAFFDEAHFVSELLSAEVPMGHGLIRVLPVASAVESNPKRVKLEEISYWLNKYAPSLAVTRCQCKYGSTLLGEGGADPVEDICIELGKFAESCIKTGRSRRITVEEALEIVEHTEKLGYVHEVTNIDGAENSMFLCNCEWDVCLALRTGWWCNTPNMTRSNYVATVDPTKCTACGQCAEVCPQTAVRIGERLCQINPVEVPWSELPDDKIWHKSHWQRDFRTTRTTVQHETGTSPCKTACPAHISVQGYLQLAKEGRITEALELIKKENPLPAVCGSICNKRCEGECTRGDIDEAVAIDDVKNYIARTELKAEHQFVPEKRFNYGEKIAVIGAGPAGISCAYYAAQMGHDVTVFDRNEKPGGMLVYGVPSFRLEKDVVAAEIDVLTKLGVKFECGVEVGKDITIQQLREQGFKGIYLAIGAQGGRKLGVPGEELPGVLSGIDFLRSVALGEMKELHGNVIVVGGGNVAVDVARTAVRMGAKSVTMYSLEQRNELPAAADEVAEAEAEGIQLMHGRGPKDILSDESGKLTGVCFRKCTSVFNAEGRFAPQYDESDLTTAEADFVIAAIGQSIQWGNLLDGTAIQVNRNQTIQADPELYTTAEPDICAGGDVFTGPKFAIDAIAAGKEAAISLNRMVQEGHDLRIGRDRRVYEAIDKTNIAIAPEELDLTPRQVPAVNEELCKTFRDERLTLTPEQITKETERCLRCGAAHVDQNICIGCGLCTTRCKFDAISIDKVYDVFGGTYEELIPDVIKYLPKRFTKIAKRSFKDAVAGTGKKD